MAFLIIVNLSETRTITIFIILSIFFTSFSSFRFLFCVTHRKKYNLYFNLRVSKKGEIKHISYNE